MGKIIYNVGKPLKIILPNYYRNVICGHVNSVGYGNNV